MLQPQSSAPAFEVGHPDGHTVRLNDYAGSRLWLVLSRWSSCPFCSLRLDRIGRRFSEVQQAGVKMLVVFPSPHARIRRYVKRYSPPFDVGTDPERTIYRDYESECSWKGNGKALLKPVAAARALWEARTFPIPDDSLNRLPADFLIDPAGNIDQTHYGEQLDDGFEVEAVTSWAAGFQGQG